MSQLLVRLDHELQTLADPIKRAEILARKGSYFARVGRFEDAREIIRLLRQDFGNGQNGHVTARIMLTEGLLHLFETLSPLAMDRIARSQILGLAMKDTSVIAVASAWKAHIEFDTSEFDEMVKSLKLGLSHAREDDHDAFARLAMVLSDSFLLCGDRQQAQNWYLRSRNHALADGDRASIEALLYNRAAFGLAWLRAAKCLGNISPEQLSLLRLEIDSARNLQDLIGIAALTNYVYLCDARLLILEESYASAIQALRHIRNSTPFADYNFSQSFVDLELSFCMHQLGNMEEAQELYRSISLSSFDKLDVDEQLVAYWMCFVMCKTDARFGDCDQAKIGLEAAANKYRQLNQRLVEILQPFRGNG